MLVKKNKDNVNWKHCNKASNKDKNKTKFYNSSFANQSQTQAFKKDQHSCWKGYLVTGINTIKVAKKNKNKAKDLSYIKCYTGK